ncbi:MAG: DUF1329 domain-containing protein [Deltaproteobacteria bacterium]|nr:DUF1329 domain-containing protein [Deltaproteobacteria bacterium]
MNVDRTSSIVHRRPGIGVSGFVIAALSFLVVQHATADEKPASDFTAENWTNAVGFAPDLKAVPEYKAGETIDSRTWQKIAPWIPDSIAGLIEKFGLKLRTAAYRPIHPSRGYIRATAANLGKARIVKTGKSIRKKGIDGYLAGLPFPHPQNGDEVAWDYNFNYLGDDGGLRFGVLWIDADRGVHRTEEWRWNYISRAMHRTDIEPLPEIPSFAGRQIQYASLTWAKEPYDKAGLAALFYRFEEPLDQRGYLYIPRMRRTLKLTFGAKGVPWNKTDMLYEDVRGYAGYPEWSYWKLLGKRTIMAPMHARIPLGADKTALTFDFDNAPHWNPFMDWEPRPVYVLEERSKEPFWTCPYKRTVMYVDAETFYIPIKEAYDEEGHLWKVAINAYNDSPDMDTDPPPIALTVVIDIQRTQATAFPTYDVFSNAGLEGSRFTETYLRREGK